MKTLLAFSQPRNQNADPGALTARGKMSPTLYAYATVCLCVLACMAEGYDLQAMAFAAPVLKAKWALRAVDVAALISASIVGVILGSFILAPLGDRLGRKPSIVVALFLAGTATVASAYAPGLYSLMATRLVAGLGLGLALPNVTALAMEIMPANKKGFAVVFVSCGYPLGAAIGGVFAGTLIADFGYQAIFLLGGVATLAVMVLSLVLMPESPAFLSRKPKRREEWHILLDRLALPFQPLDNKEVGEQSRSLSGKLASLFVPERRLSTGLLWTINFFNVALAYFFVSWLPSIFVARGLSAQDAINGTSLFGLSGMIGGLCMGALLARMKGTQILVLGYATVVIATVVLTLLHRVDTLFLAVLAVTGGAVVGSQFCLNAVVALFYPSDIRATAGGYAAGIGRIGALTAPAIGATIAQSDFFARYAFAVATGLALVALVATLVLHLRTRNRGGRDEADAVSSGNARVADMAFYTSERRRADTAT